MLVSKTNQFRAQALMDEVFKRAEKVRKLDGTKHDNNPSVDIVEIQGKRFRADHHRVSSSGTVTFDNAGKPSALDLRDTRKGKPEYSQLNLSTDGDITTISESLSTPSYTRGTVVTFLNSTMEITGFDEYLEA